MTISTDTLREQTWSGAPVFETCRRSPADRVEHLGHEGSVEIARDEDDVRFVRATRPCRQFERRMKQALDGLHHDRTAPADDVENALHAQQVGAMAHHERIEPI